jgi:hypothetical protein
MALTFLDPNTIGAALSCAWRTQLDTSESPSNDGKWDTKGANGDDIGLYGGLTDSVPTALTFDMNAAQVTTSEVIADSVDVNDLDGKNDQYNSVTLTYQYTTSTSSTHTVTDSITAGTKFTIQVSQVLTKEDIEFSLSFTWTSSESETNATTQSQVESTTVNVYAQPGTVLRAAITGTVQQITIPYTCIVKVTGTTETWFNSQVKDPQTGEKHYNYSTDAGTAFGWINKDKCAGADSSDYSDGGSGTGFVTMTGTVTMIQTVNFSTSVTDVTSDYTNTDVTSEQTT